jgi:hypothetical protein
MTDVEVYLLIFVITLLAIFMIHIITKQDEIYVTKFQVQGNQEDKCKDVTCNRMQRCEDGKCLPENQQTQQNQQAQLKYVDCPTKSPNPQCIWKMLENDTDKKCISSSTAVCNERSSKIECEQHIGVWVPLDYSKNPYTCISSEKVSMPLVSGATGASQEPQFLDKKGQDCIITGVKVGNYKFDDNFSNKCSAPIKDNDLIGCCNVSDNKCTFDFNSAEFGVESKIKNWIGNCRDKTAALKDVGSTCDTDSECRSLICVRTRPMDLASSKQCVRREFYTPFSFPKSSRSRYEFLE